MVVVVVVVVAIALIIVVMASGIVSKTISTRTVSTRKSLPGNICLAIGYKIVQLKKHYPPGLIWRATHVARLVSLQRLTPLLSGW